MNQKVNHVIMEYCWKYNKPGFEPYSWMVNDLYRGIQAGENYLVALGLFTYSEAVGRLILNTIDNNKIGAGLKAYKKFTKEYINYSFTEKEWKRLFDDVRNGLTHRYFIKNRFGTVFNEDEDGTRSCGIEFDKDKINIYIHSYFKHFVAGLEKYLDEINKNE